MEANNSLAVILAAGKGTRMSESVPKPLVQVNGSSIISWIINSFKKNNIDVALVINPKHKTFFDSYKNLVQFVYQKNQNGTGHAVMKASKIIDKYEHIYVFVGDSPFVGSKIIFKMFKEHIDTSSDVTILSSIFKNKKFPYARIIRDVKGNVEKIVEEIDANDKELENTELFCSHYLFKSETLINYLPKLKNNSKTGEIYFTDILNELIFDKKNINSLIIHNWKRLVGLNTKQDIKWIESQKII